MDIKMTTTAFELPGYKITTNKKNKLIIIFIGEIFSIFEILKAIILYYYNFNFD